MQKLSELVWWPTLYHDVERWVSTCAVCKLTKPQKALTAEMRSRLYLRPFRVLVIDTVGPITPAVWGFEYIFHVSCPFSGFLWFQAVAKNDGATWAHWSRRTSARLAVDTRKEVTPAVYGSAGRRCRRRPQQGRSAAPQR